MTDETEKPPAPTVNAMTPPGPGFDLFIKVYAEELAVAVRDHPDEYVGAPWPDAKTAQVVYRIGNAIKARTYNKDSRAFRATCKRLGVAHTYKAIDRYCGTVKTQGEKM